MLGSTVHILQSLLKFLSIQLMMLSNHLILCFPLLLPSIFLSIRVFSNESVHHIRWWKYWREAPKGESCSVISDSLRPHGRQHARLPCPALSSGACSNSCPSSRWGHPTISSSVVPFSSHLQIFPKIRVLFINTLHLYTILGTINEPMVTWYY